MWVYGKDERHTLSEMVQDVFNSIIAPCQSHESEKSTYQRRQLPCRPLKCAADFLFLFFFLWLELIIYIFQSVAAM